MHIVSRRNMLALPVERLVGSSHSHGHNRTRPPMVMSPDSSASDSSNSDSPNTPNAKVFSSYASQLLTHTPHNSSHSSINNNGRPRSPSPAQQQTPPPSTMKLVSSMTGNNTASSSNNNCIISSTSDESEVKIKTSNSPAASPSGPPQSAGDSEEDSRGGASDDGCHEDAPLLSPCRTGGGPDSKQLSGKGKERRGSLCRNEHKGNGNGNGLGMEIQLTVEAKREEESGSSIGSCSGSCSSSKRRRNSCDDNREGNKMYRNNRDGDSGTSAELSSAQQKMTIRLIENDHMDAEMSGDIVDGDSEPKPRARPASRNNSLSKMDNVLDDSSDENNSISGRPPSRPPSSASSTVTSTFPLSPASTQSASSETPSPIKGSFPIISRPHRPHHHHTHIHSHHSHHASHYHQQLGDSMSTSTNTSSGNSMSISNALKFSIDDILRPEFGKVAIQRIGQSTRSPQSHNHRRSSANSFAGEFPESQSQSHPYSSSGSHLPHSNVPPPHQHPYARNKEANNNHGGSGRHLSHSPSSSIDSNSNNGGSQSQRHGRPSSVKDHSEDSNSSCTSRKEEVVDETKVNPKVPQGPLLWPAWVYCTRYSDRPSSGPRSRRVRKKDEMPIPGIPKVRETPEEKRPRTAFTAEQLARLKQEFDENRYLTERRRQDLARDLKLHENQIKIWFQNKRAKLKKSTGTRGGLAIQLMAQGLYNHSTVPIDEDDEMYEAMMQQQ